MSISQIPFLKIQGSRAEIILCLFSKKSVECRDIITNISNDIKKFIRFVCIDDPDINKTILKSKNIKIKQLPCILVLYSTSKGLIAHEFDINQLIHNFNILLQPNKNPINIIDPDALANEPIRPVKSEEYNSREATRIKNKPNVEFSNGISTYIEKPKRGVGHSKLAHSSINISEIEGEDDEYTPDISDNTFLDDSLRIGKSSSLDEKKASIAEALQRASAEREQLQKNEEIQKTSGNVSGGKQILDLDELDI